MWYIFNRPQVRALPDYPSNTLSNADFEAEMQNVIANNRDFNQLHDTTNAIVMSFMEAVYGYSVVNYLKPGTTEFNELKGHITYIIYLKEGVDSTTKVRYTTVKERTFDTDVGQFRAGVMFDSTLQPVQVLS